jgi:hypothetical protein
MEGKDTKPTLLNILFTLKQNVIKRLVTLIFLFETGSLGDKMKYDDWRNKYDLLSNRINKFTQWFEENWNEFPSPETGNL